jgi:hypothetical protein
LDVVVLVPKHSRSCFASEARAWRTGQAGKTFGEFAAPLGVPPPSVFGLVHSLELFGGVLADGFEHRVAGSDRGAVVLEEVVLEEAAESLRCGFADRLSGFECAAAGEDGEAAEITLLFLIEQVVAPLNGGAEGLLAGGEVVRAAG